MQANSPGCRKYSPHPSSIASFTSFMLHILCVSHRSKYFLKYISVPHHFVVDISPPREYLII